MCLALSAIIQGQRGNCSTDPTLKSLQHKKNIFLKTELLFSCFMCVGVLPACMSLYCVHVFPEEARILETRVIDNC